MKISSQEQELLYAKLNMETAQMPWRELQRYFASGHIIAIGSDMDLVNVAVMIAADDTDNISRLLQEHKIEKVTDEQAQAWFDEDIDLWTVVVKPWILVQVDNKLINTH